jgi:hypothetical protein
MAPWTKGQSGNRKGRPKSGTAIAELARGQVARHKLVEKLGRIGAGLGEYGKLDVDQQMRAIQLLLAYGYGPPRAEMNVGEGVVIQVVYAETNHIAVTSAAPGAAEDNPGGEALQRRLLRAPVGKDPAGDQSSDSLGPAR